MRTVHGVGTNSKLYRKRHTQHSKVSTECLRYVLFFFASKHKNNKNSDGNRSHGWFFPFRLVCSAYRPQIMKTFLSHFRDCCGCRVSSWYLFHSFNWLWLHTLKSRKYLISSCGQLYVFEHTTKPQCAVYSSRIFICLYTFFLLFKIHNKWFAIDWKYNSFLGPTIFFSLSLFFEKSP